MKNRTLIPGMLVLAAGLAAHAPPARAEVVAPKPLAPQSGIPQGLVCTAEALNVSGFIGSDGRVDIYNVPAGQGAVRVRATCEDAQGTTITGQSAALTPIPGGTVRFGAIDFGTAIPVAARLNVSPVSARLLGVGALAQLTVGAQFADQTSGDVTLASAGTTYRTSNPLVATVSPNGQVKAIGPGTALIFAQNEGASGLASVNIVPAALQSIEVVPGSISLVENPLFAFPQAQLQVQGHLGNGATLDLTRASSGVVYTSADPLVASVSADGTISPVGAGQTTVTVTDTASGLADAVPVQIVAFSPSGIAAFDTPGFAHRVDLDGRMAFVADGPAGLQILDVSSGATFGSLGFAGAQALDVRVRGPLAVVALGAGGLALVNVADPAAPALHTILSGIGTVRDVAISGNTVYAASTGGLYTYDVSNPASPSLLGAQSFGSTVTAVDGDSTRGVAVALTSDPALIVVRAGGAAVTVPLPAATNQASDVALSGTSAYVANGRGGLVEVDLTDPAAPVVRSSSTLDFDALGVAVQRSVQGTIVAAADDRFVNAIPFFDKKLRNSFNLDFAAFPGVIQEDANGTGIALGDGFGVITVGAAGVEVFRTRQIVDNAGLAPTVTITAPSDGTTLPNGFGVISALASDDVGVASVDFFANGVKVASVNAPPFKTFFLAPAVGATILTARATDFGGNQTESLAVTVTTQAVSPCLTSIGAGFSSTCALKSDHSVWCWGYNEDGELGDGTLASPKPTPVLVTALDHSVAELAMGESHSCARKVDGTIWCWGYNDYGQVAGGAPEGTTPVPVQQTDLVGNFVELSAGYFQTCARRDDGTVWCWGYNGEGELGDGTLLERTTPVQTLLGNNVVQISAGEYHSCALKADGTAWCWGDNTYGQCGDNTAVTTRPTPVQVAGLGANVAEVRAGYFHSCARKTDGTIWCWGHNGVGQLGIGAITAVKRAPVQVSTFGNTAIELSTGYIDTCARKADGTTWCWGYNFYGELGTGSGSGNVPNPTKVNALGTTAVALSVGGYQVCARTPDGSASCWGRNIYGEVGDGTLVSPRATPTPIALTCP